jgi:hypothetical protein
LKSEQNFPQGEEILSGFVKSSTSSFGVEVATATTSQKSVTNALGWMLQDSSEDIANHIINSSTAKAEKNAAVAVESARNDIINGAKIGGISGASAGLVYGLLSIKNRVTKE